MLVESNFKTHFWIENQKNYLFLWSCINLKEILKLFPKDNESFIYYIKQLKCRKNKRHYSHVLSRKQHT